MTLSPQTRTQISAIRDRYPHPRSAILPALWAVQNELGFLSADGMAVVAELLRLAPSEVQAVSTFYSMYFERPAGEHHVVVCVNVSCALRGGDDIVSHLQRTLACPSGGTTADGRFTWESTVECLGACGGAPAMQVDHLSYENLTTDWVDDILKQVQARAPADGFKARSAFAAPSSGPHPPAAETPPAATAEGPPSEGSATSGGDGFSEAARSPAVEQTERPGSKTDVTANPQGARSAPRRKRPRPSADDL